MHIVVTDGDFEAKVMKSEKLVLVDFWAEWCGPCRMQNPILEEIDKELGDKAVIAKMNVDEQSQTPQKYGIMSIPTLMMFKGGQMVKMWIGVQSKQVLVEEFNKHMS